MTGPASVVVGQVLHLRVVEASELIAADKGGTSDPFAVAALLDARGRPVHEREKLKTGGLKNTRNPRWCAPRAPRGRVG